MGENQVQNFSPKTVKAYDHLTDMAAEGRIKRNLSLKQDKMWTDSL
jgi:hypothetical protein